MFPVLTASITLPNGYAYLTDALPNKTKGCCNIRSQ